MHMYEPVLVPPPVSIFKTWPNYADKNTQKYTVALIHYSWCTRVESNMSSSAIPHFIIHKDRNLFTFSASRGITGSVYGIRKKEQLSHDNSSQRRKTFVPSYMDNV